MGRCWSLGQTSNSPVFVTDSITGPEIFTFPHRFGKGGTTSRFNRRGQAPKPLVRIIHSRISYRVSPIAKTDTVDFDFLAKKLCPAMDLHQFADRNF
jgi:hypothetical protein